MQTLIQSIIMQNWILNGSAPVRLLFLNRQGHLKNFWKEAAGYEGL